jgi:hypothetical protein
MTVENKPLAVEQKSPVSLNPSRGVARELDLLYQRRAVIVNLIQSLEVYERCHAVTTMDARRRKTA